MPTLSFTNGNDSYTVSSAGTYVLDFLAGADTLTVKGGTSTTAHMGDGNDLAIVKVGPSTIYGDAGADRFDVYAANAIIDGGADNDTINVRGGLHLKAHGGIGEDRFNFYGDAGSAALFGDDGNDLFYGGFHTISGGIRGGAGNDYFAQFGNFAGQIVTLYGGAGDDLYRADPSSPATFVENAFEGVDTVQVARGVNYTLPDNIENIVVQGFSGSSTGTAATLTGNASDNSVVAHDNVETIFGLDGDDTLSAKGGDDSLYGGNGADYLEGGTGNDLLFGEAGNDTLQGRSGDDTMSGGAGDDTYYVDSYNDTIHESGGEGNDTVCVSASSFTIYEYVETAIVQSGVGGVLIEDEIGIDTVMIGNSGDDQLLGNGGEDTLKGGAGNDILNGGTEIDAMYGGLGNDTYYVDNLSDTVVEQADRGFDSVIVNVSGYTLPGNVENGLIISRLVDGLLTGGTLSGNFGDNVLAGQNGDDSLNGSFGNDVLNGNGGDDSLGSGPGNDVVYAGEGADYVSGGDDGDTLYGEGGSDTIDGNDGIDQIWGDAGADTLTGGADGDIFLFGSINDSLPGASAYDTITDFDTASDVINLSLIDANSVADGDQAFNTNGTSTNTPGDLWIGHYGGVGSIGNYMIYGDVNGDGNADFQLLVHLASGTVDQMYIVH